jgi:hypothetical protein
MATPFTIQSFVFQCHQEFNDIKNNIPKYKLKFCLDLENELPSIPIMHAENIFDYIYNLFYVKAAFTAREHKLWLNEFMDIDFLDLFVVGKYIDNAYQQIIFKNKVYVMQLFGIAHDDAAHAANQFHKNLKKNIEIIAKGIF